MIALRESLSEDGLIAGSESSEQVGQEYGSVVDDDEERSSSNSLQHKLVAPPAVQFQSAINNLQLSVCAALFSTHPALHSTALLTTQLSAFPDLI